jgi:hypothetical protein
MSAAAVSRMLQEHMTVMSVNRIIVCDLYIQTIIVCDLYTNVMSVECSPQQCYGHHACKLMCNKAI